VECWWHSCLPGGKVLCVSLWLLDQEQIVGQDGTGPLDCIHKSPGERQRWPRWGRCGDVRTVLGKVLLLLHSDRP
jgi:hypothetical protein